MFILGWSAALDHTSLHKFAPNVGKLGRVLFPSLNRAGADNVPEQEKCSEVHTQ